MKPNALESLGMSQEYYSNGSYRRGDVPSFLVLMDFNFYRVSPPRLKTIAGGKGSTLL